MWLVTTYRHTAPFSLRTSSSTSSGGSTNLVPTMYAVKMALLDAAYRSGLNGEELFPWVRDLDIRFEPPAEAVVTNSFVKILSEPKDKKSGPAFISTVGYREFVMFAGELRVALGIDGLSEEQVQLLQVLLLHIQYFGKRGSFVQAVRQEQVEDLGIEYGSELGGAVVYSDQVILQYLDDMGGKASFESINTFSDVAARVGRDRVMKSVLLPYRIKRSSRGFTWYSRRRG